MKYYIFPNGTLKTDIALREIIRSDRIDKFKELSKVQFYKNRSVERSKSALNVAKVACKAVKNKAIAIKSVL